MKSIVDPWQKQYKMDVLTSTFATVCPIDGLVNPAIDIISPAPALSIKTMFVPFFFISFRTYKRTNMKLTHIIEFLVVERNDIDFNIKNFPILFDITINFGYIS